MSEQVIGFLDPNPAVVRPEHKALFADFGLEAYTIIADMESQEREREEELAWDAKSPVRGEPSDDDDEIDLGPLEPDTYGE